jgi:hypothetical protein
MKKIVFLMAAMVLVSLAAGCQNGSTTNYMESTPTMTPNGYEMYSWLENGEWYFALVEASPKRETLEEVKYSEWVVKGLEAFKASLEYMPAGESLFWTEGVVEGTVLPNESVLFDIVEYCRTLGIDITIAI